MPLPSISSIESDLINASLGGRADLLAAVQHKIGELQLSADERDEAITIINEELVGGRKFASDVQAPGAESGASKPWEAPSWLAPALLAGTVLAPAASEGIKYLANKFTDRREDNWNAVANLDPDVAANPRGRALFDFVHNMAPTVTNNPVVTADILKQMTSMPLVDIGTVGRMADIGKSAPRQGFDMGPVNATGSAILGVGKANDSINKGIQAFGGKAAGLNWESPAIKAAGITAPFTGLSGSGTQLQQADNSFALSQEVGQMPTFSLDQVVRELMAKEQELSIREEAIAAREQALMSAAQMHQGMGQAYQSEYGADPYAGTMDDTQAEDPMDQPAGDDEAAEAQAQALAQAQAQDPSAGQDPTAEAQAQAQDPSAGQDPTAGAQDPTAGAQDPTAGNDEHDHALIQQLEGAGPNTAESVEGTPEDEAHDAANKVQEGTPEDETADAELAAVLNAGGHIAGAPGQEQVPAAAPAQAAVTPNASGGFTLQIPLPSLSITISADQGAAALAQQPKIASRDTAVERAKQFLESLSI